MGRLIEFTDDIGRQICAALAEGKTLREVCRAEGMPSESTVRTWVLDNRSGFAAHYARAREVGYQSMADELLEVADDGTNDWMERQDDKGKELYVLNGEHVQRSRLRVDTRKWLLSKALPKVYGDKLAVTGGGPHDEPVKHIHEIRRTIVDPEHPDSPKVPPVT